VLTGRPDERRPVNSTTVDPTGRVGASVGVLRAGQHRDGGYVACPTYPTYHYVWLRDGAFCAYALGLHGEHGSAAAFQGSLPAPCCDTTGCSMPSLHPAPTESLWRICPRRASH
jgi:hypothetical protein